MNTHIVRALSVAALAALCLAGLPMTSTAATAYTWNAVGNSTWDTSSLNWTTDAGASSVAWTDGNDAIFSGFGSLVVVTPSGNITATSLTTNSTGGTTTMQIKNSTGNTFSLNVPTITVNGTSIDMYTKITGTHDLHLIGTAAARLNLKASADYTGDTFLDSGAYLLTDTVNNALPTTTTLNMIAGTTFRFAGTNITQQITGLSGAGTLQSTSTGNILTINTKSAITTTYNGTMSGSGLSLVINGSGTQNLTGTNSFTGTATISGGTLSLGSTLSASTITISGGVLTSSVSNINLGTGGVSMSSGEISIRGTGAGGTFTVAANQAFSTTGGKLTFNLGTSIDQIKGSGSGTFSIGSGTELALITGTGFSYSSTYQLLSGFASGSVTSSGLTITGYDTTNYLATLDNTGLLSFASAIPEPSTYAALAGLAVLGLVAFRRRTRSRC